MPKQLRFSLGDDGAGLLVLTFESPEPLAAVDCQRLMYRMVQRDRSALRPSSEKNT